jgi:cytochrome c6
MKKKIIFIISYIFIFNISSYKNINADDLFEKGKQIFLEEGNCATCHALEDANSYGNIGPNLNEIKPDISRVLMAVTNGIGVMPAYQGQLSDEEIHAVATYVVESTN